MFSRIAIGLVVCAAFFAAGCETFRAQTNVRSEYEADRDDPPIQHDGYVKLRVKPGQTLSGIAREYHTSPRAIADASGLSDPDTVVAGERVLVPTARKTTPTPRQRMQPLIAQDYRPPARRADGIAVSPLSDPSEMRATPRQNPIHFASFFSSAPEPARRSSGGKGKFDWPVEGELLVKYGPSSTGERSDGINIAANPGAPVRAAADGVVTYTGQIKSYGKIILIEHAGGYVTTYAHNSEIRVRKGERVRRGETIALAGATGNVDRPQLHFEIRRDGDPVDPRKLLVALN